MKLKWKITLPVLSLLLASTFLTTLLNYTTTKNSIEQMVDSIIESNLDTLTDEISRALATEKIVFDELSNKNISLARSIAEMLRLQANQGTLNLDNYAYFQQLTSQLGIIELNITDAEGTIVGSNFDDYYGWNYGSAESTRHYLRLLDNPQLEIIEEPRQDAISGNMTQYFGVARSDAKGFVQIGFDANVVGEFRNHLDFAHTAEGMRVGATGYAVAIQDGTVLYSKVTENIGKDVAGDEWYRQVSSGRGKAWIDIDDENMYTGYANIGDMTVLILFPRTEYDDYLDPAIFTGLIGAAIALAISVFIIIFLTIILRPVKLLTKASHDLARGSFQFKHTRHSKDEIGILGSNFEIMADTFASYIDEINNALKCFAEGDLKVAIDREYIGQFASIKDSINTISTELNGTFAEIVSAADSVSSGARQFSDNSRSMAQGSTEQAESINRLSSSITEIAEQITSDAGTAEKTAALAETIKSSAEKGSRHMNEMMSAVKEIHEASQSIGKVISVIDNIAFQTNILALNAAVEAARAGQHGKGFAVVAEEVRSLAAKSAEAAKDTGALIQNSMEKADLGSRIAGETAASLTEIVTGINESVLLITEMAKSSEQQSSRITQIHSGIDRVTQMVQQTSSIAAECAGSSDEMTTQSDLLQRSVSHFQLNKSIGGKSATPLLGGKY
jgi:methyl-accepting chemotaxis protein